MRRARHCRGFWSDLRAELRGDPRAEQLVAPLVVVATLVGADGIGDVRA
jgi:hypothetical protein